MNGLMRGPEQSYRPDVDGLRALAVLAVVAFHGFPQWLPGGYIGVDVFFVISGFLISGQLMAAAADGRYSFGDFYARRIRRIFPALTVVLIAVALVGWWVLLPHEWIELRRHVGASAIFSNNFLLWSEAGYFDGPSELKPLLHLWSLGVEEQFYVVWPLLIWWWWSRNLRWVPMIAITAAASFALNIILVTDGAATSAFFLPHARLWQLAAGALLAAWSQEGHSFGQAAARTLYRSPGPDGERRINDLFSVAGVTLIVLSCVALGQGPTAPNWWSDGAYAQVSIAVRWIARVLWLDGSATAYPGWSALAPTLGAVLVIAAGPRAVWNRSWLSMRPVVAIGLISYPLYLWHWPILSFLQITEQGDVPRPLRLVGIVIATALAAITYVAVERPIRRLAAPATLLRVMPIAAPLVAIGIATLISIQSGWLVPPPKTATQVDDQVPITLNEAQCRSRYPGLGEYCQQFDPSRPVTTALLGDSHAAHFLPGLGAAVAARGGNVAQLGQTGCPPLLNIARVGQVGDNTCARVNAAIIEAVARDTAITDVWLSFRGAMAVTGEGFGPEADPQADLFRLITGTGVNAQAIREGLRSTIVVLQARGKRVGVLLQVPELGFRTVSCTGRPVSVAYRPARTPCAVPLAVVLERQASYRAMIAELQREFSIEVYDPAQALCDDSHCHAVEDGKMLYHDDNHLGVNGSARAMRRF